MTMGTETSGKKSLKTYGDAFDVTMLQSDVLIVNEKFAVFGKDFETSLRKQLLGYEEKEQKVKETFGPAKPLVRERSCLAINERGNNRRQLAADQDNGRANCKIA